MISFFNDLKSYFNFLRISKNKEAFFIDNKHIVKYLRPYISKHLLLERHYLDLYFS